MMLIQWEIGKALTWVVTVVCPLTELYMKAAVRDAGAVAKVAAAYKSTKYVALGSRYIFQPIAVDKFGPVTDSTTTFLCVLG